MTVYNYKKTNEHVYWHETMKFDVTSYVSNYITNWMHSLDRVSTILPECVFFVESSRVIFIYESFYKNLNLSMKTFIRLIRIMIWKLPEWLDIICHNISYFYHPVSTHNFSEYSFNFVEVLYQLVLKEGFPMSRTHIYRVSLMI